MVTEYLRDNVYAGIFFNYVLVGFIGKGNSMHKYFISKQWDKD